jgi:hypothetical protein
MADNRFAGDRQPFEFAVGTRLVATWSSHNYAPCRCQPRLPADSVIRRRLSPTALSNSPHSRRNSASVTERKTLRGQKTRFIMRCRRGCGVGSLSPWPALGQHFRVPRAAYVNPCLLAWAIAPPWAVTTRARVVEIRSIAPIRRMLRAIVERKD